MYNGKNNQKLKVKIPTRVMDAFSFGSSATTVLNSGETELYQLFSMFNICRFLDQGQIRGT
jgi:hypothetical protein